MVRFVGGRLDGEATPVKSGRGSLGEVRRARKLSDVGLLVGGYDESGGWSYWGHVAGATQVEGQGQL